MKDYLGDLLYFSERLKKRQTFSLARFGDGELRILKHEPIDYAEWKYDPEDPTDAIFRQRALQALRYKHETFYAGLSCPHCIGEADFQMLKRESGQDDHHLTWSTLFVNSNYQNFLAHFLPQFIDYKVVLICKNVASLRGLPFPVLRDFRVGINAWKEDYPLIKQIQTFIANSRIEGGLFLLCAGPFSCLLAHQLHSFCPANFYIDIGSAIDPYLFAGDEGLTRGYLRGTAEIAERCVWI